MTKHVLIALVGMRNEAADKVQKILTGWGCFIKTRLGLHEDVLENCTQTGLIFLELVGEPEKLQELERKLNLIPSVNAQLLTLTIPVKD
ncbi:MAG: hypothetical protein LWX09_00740 [Bacteroidia bacterium]|jgi:hypothetical protein|nr:hypothetical protein [Bacteroidia bacterium]